MTNQLAGRLYALDIETDTTINGLDPHVAAITAVALDGDCGLTVIDSNDERDLLVRLRDKILSQEPGTIVTWNGAAFDLPFLADRAKLHSIDLKLALTPDPHLIPKYGPLAGHDTSYHATWGPHAHVDICDAYKAIAADAGIEWSLKPVATHFGFHPIAVDRANMHQLSSDEIRAYVASDATVTLGLARALGAPSRHGSTDTEETITT